MSGPGPPSMPAPHLHGATEMRLRRPCAARTRLRPSWFMLWRVRRRTESEGQDVDVDARQHAARTQRARQAGRDDGQGVAGRRGRAGHERHRLRVPGRTLERPVTPASSSRVSVAAVRHADGAARLRYRGAQEALRPSAPASSPSWSARASRPRWSAGRTSGGRLPGPPRPWRRSRLLQQPRLRPRGATRAAPVAPSRRRPLPRPRLARCGARRRSRCTGERAEGLDCSRPARCTRRAQALGEAPAAAKPAVLLPRRRASPAARTSTERRVGAPTPEGRGRSAPREAEGAAASAAGGGGDSLEDLIRKEVAAQKK